MSTTPPPLALHAAMAALILFVFKVRPSATAPYLTMLNVSFLNTGTFAVGRFVHEYFAVCAVAPTAMPIEAANNIIFLFIIYGVLVFKVIAVGSQPGKVFFKVIFDASLSVNCPDQLTLAVAGDPGP